MRSTFKRVTAAFDVVSEQEVDEALKELELNPEQLHCVYCGLPATCWDHLVPAAIGGTHQLRNLAPACTSCNNRKGNKGWSEYFDVLEQSAPMLARQKLLKTYTASYSPGESLISDPRDQKRLDNLLDEIHKAMSEADEIVSRAIQSKSRQRG